MKGKFSLEPVLEYKKQVEEKLVRELMQARAVFNKRYDKLTELKQLMMKTKDEFSSKSSTGMKSSERTIYVHYINNLDDQINHQEKLAAEAQIAVNEKLIEVVEASKSSKMLEELKKKEIKEYHDLINKLEMKELDEVAVQGYVKKQKDKSNENF